jgi:hypothetical protein
MRNATDELVDENEPLWRYFKTERFIELLSSSKLYFASATQFQDPFEGATAVLPHGAYIDPRYPLDGDLGEHAFEQLRRLTKISCWHRASYESDAMWQLYAGAWKGVAIRTTSGRLSASASTFRLEPQHQGEDLWGGNVRYVDLLSERLNVNMLGRFWHKHMAFAWEREFRLGISLRFAEEFGVPVPEQGILVPFNLDQLIRSAVEQAGLGGRVKVSSMLGTPRYT